MALKRTIFEIGDKYPFHSLSSEKHSTALVETRLVVSRCEGSLMMQKQKISVLKKLACPYLIKLKSVAEGEESIHLIF